MKLGKFEITALSDGTCALDGGAMFGVIPKTMWEKRVPADSRNRVRFALTCLLVQTGKQNILIETGLGDKWDAKHADIYGVAHETSLPEDLRRAGLAPEQIDIVINTHLHFDHCGWNTRRQGTRTIPTFPRARYVIQRGEWEHARHPSERDRASYIEEFFLAAEPQTDFLEGPAEIAPGVRVELTPGHVRDLQCVWIESEGERAFFISDLVPMRAHLQYPWIMGFDLYPLETLATKKKLLPRLARERVLVVFPHDPEVAWGRLTERDGSIEFQALTDVANKSH